jgi:hypothetical protein
MNDITSDPSPTARGRTCGRCVSLPVIEGARRCRGCPRAEAGRLEPERTSSSTPAAVDHPRCGSTEA